MSIFDKPESPSLSSFPNAEKEQIERQIQTRKISRLIREFAKTNDLLLLESDIEELAEEEVNRAETYEQSKKFSSL